MTSRNCENCGRHFGPSEQSFSYLGRVICKTCKIGFEKQLQALTGTDSDRETETPSTDEQVKKDNETKSETPIIEKKVPPLPPPTSLPQSEDVPTPQSPNKALTDSENSRSVEIAQDEARRNSDINSTADIVLCRKCGAKNRVKPHSATAVPVCGKCRSPLVHSKPTVSTVRVLSNLMLLIALAGSICGIAFTPSLLHKDFSELRIAEQRKTNEYSTTEEKKLVDLESQWKFEVAQIDPAKLHEEATAYYRAVLDARRSYDKRYALTSREKAQLRMREYTSDSAKSYREAVRSVALEASPKGSDIDVSESSQGITLRIDFDMSSMTSGEYGTRTKHSTKESLKKEVVTLISRVTNDVFQFCRDFDIQAIYVGCRHHVATEYPDGSTRDENQVLYKICVRKSSIPELSDNPFLDIYSTTEHFETEEDNFANIEIVITRI